MSQREIFAHAPLVFVTAEIRLMYEPSVNRSETRDAFGLAMRPSLPLLELETNVGFSVDGVAIETTAEPMQQIRALNETRTMSVSLSHHALTIEVIEYDEYANFRRLIETSLKALAAIVPDARVIRLGLRYLDEVRVPGIEDTKDWKGWISPDLLAPAGILPGRTVDGLSGQLLIHLGDRSRSLLRWGEMSGSTVLNPASPLRVATPETSRFFVLDVDCFWEQSMPVPAEISAILGKFDELHEPTGAIFSASVTDRSRKLFRGGHDG